MQEKIDKLETQRKQLKNKIKILLQHQNTVEEVKKN